MTGGRNASDWRETGKDAARGSRGWTLHVVGVGLIFFAAILGGSFAVGQEPHGSPSSPAQPVQPTPPPAANQAAGSSTPAAAAQTASPEAEAAAKAQAANEAKSETGAQASLAGWKGLRVDRVEFRGVVFAAKDPLPGQLPQQAGEPLDPAKVTASIRRLFASGRYRDIRVMGERNGAGVTLIYAGTPRYFVGRVTIAGVKDERLASSLEYATKLSRGRHLPPRTFRQGRRGCGRRCRTADTFRRQ